MRTILFTCFLLVSLCPLLKSQTNEKTQGFYDIKISYIYSSKGYRTAYKNKLDVKIPLGIGLSGSYRFSDRIYTELGVVYKIEDEKIEIGRFYSDPPGHYSGDIYHKYNYKYIDIPMLFHYNIIKFKSISLNVSAGVKGTFFQYKDYWNPYFDGIEYDENGNDFRIAYYVGIMEYWDFNKRFSLFLSQNYGHYFKNRNYYNNDYKFVIHQSMYDVSIDLKIGLTYKFR